MFSWTSSPLISGGPLFSPLCSAWVRHCLPWSVRVGDWCVSRLERLICCPIILTASRPGLCRSTSALLLIGSTIREFSIGSALWVSVVLCCLSSRSSYLIDHSLFWWIDVAVNWLTLYQECRRAVFWARCCSLCTSRNFFPFWRISLLVMLTTQLWWLLCHPQAL